MSNISLILLTKNEQENLKRWTWMKKLKNLNEIIVVDDGSTDDTKKIVKSFENNKITVKFFDRKLNNDFASQRNFAVSQVSNNWVLFLDADETPSEKLIEHLNNFKLNNNSCYTTKRYLVYKNNIIYHGISVTDNPIRLFNKNDGTFTGKVHEARTTNNKMVKIKFPIFHYSAPNLRTFLSKLNQYSTIRATELFEQKISVNLLDIFLYPKAKFIQYYFWHLGFVDGTPGLIICLSMSFYSFLVRSKLWKLYHS